MTVLLVDDHPVFRAGMTTVLTDLPDVTVIGEAADGAEAIATTARLLPTIVLMDLRMPGVSGLEATAQITTAHPQVAVVILTMDEDDDSVFAALRAGARGYLLKEADGTDVHRALLGVARGEAVFGPRIARRVLSHFATPPTSPARMPFPHLTNREREILDLLSRGLDNASIARRLSLSEKTIRNRVSDVLTKLRARTRAEAAALARDAGLGNPQLQPGPGPGL
ncbi:DNA-binding response regulator [Streptomyces lunaelactis]|uniref:DNA-binding response regulator n=1 Tax=Streptomyces lunaelactis TaxID=1535768 RepID=A0A2R4TDG8_9ACTN|nr:DNA-binding response regulator [Streptomyces lunaelactis]NUK05804.1 response regulator transcription factor [Streptomyces lunaelactis]NUK18182.1 response regulator transcription factor [Streptomyces lunaelactis]NUK28197.1 response regulator transcription factor [Streptomyces lunaelactis]NUK36174.1 response regulator transcription factor [Streptomyces lunaelactis]